MTPIRTLFYSLLVLSSLLMCVLLFFTSTYTDSGNSRPNIKRPRWRYRDPRLANETKQGDVFLAMWQQGIEPEIDMDQMGRRMEVRKRRLVKKCNLYKNTTSYNKYFPVDFHLYQLFIDKYHHLAWCPIYKAASSSWLHNFILLGASMSFPFKRTLPYNNNNNANKRKDTPPPLTLEVIDEIYGWKIRKGGLAAKARRFFPGFTDENANKALPNVTSFLIVRHPMERILSAYRDKLERYEGKQYYYFKYGKRIVEAFRKNTTITANTTIPTRYSTTEVTEFNRSTNKSITRKVSVEKMTNSQIIPRQLTLNSKTSVSVKTSNLIKTSTLPSIRPMYPKTTTAHLKTSTKPIKKSTTPVKKSTTPVKKSTTLIKKSTTTTLIKTPTTTPVKKSTNQQNSTTHKPYIMGKEESIPDLPTFEEYIDFLLFTDTKDEHWRPMYIYCGLCTVKYDVVMKMDTLYEDQWYLIKLLKLDKIIKARWRNANDKGLTSHEISRKYYSQIPREKILQLADKYFFDFDLFGYSAEEYINMGYVT